MAGSLMFTSLALVASAQSSIVLFGSAFFISLFGLLLFRFVFGDFVCVVVSRLEDVTSYYTLAFDRDKLNAFELFRKCSIKLGPLLPELWDREDVAHTSHIAPVEYNASMSEVGVGFLYHLEGLTSRCLLVVVSSDKGA